MAKTGSKSSKLIQLDELTPKIFFVYKKKCQINGIQISPFIRQKLQQASTIGRLQTFQTSQQLGPNQARAFIQALQQLKYKSLKKLRIWKAEFGDEGVRVICKYIEQTQNLQILDLLDNKITQLGCEFLGAALTCPQLKIKHLKLDNNNIGTQGLKSLTLGLRSVKHLDKLSLKYCNIDAKGSRYIQEIVANIYSKLRSIKLQGNPLENEGTYQVLRAMKNCGETIEKINIADVKMNLLDYKKQNFDDIQYKIRQEMLYILKHNLGLIKLQFRFNQIHDLIAEEILQIVKQVKNVKNMEFPNNVKYELKDELDTVMRARNKKSKKKVTKKKK